MTSKATRHEPHTKNSLSHWFAQFAQATSHWTGNPAAFLLAVAVVLVWVVTGPVFNYSDTWQLVINTGTTIVTFLMVFLIQHTQNRDTMALQLKLSELVLGIEGAKNKFAAVEDLSDEELEELHEECRQRANVAFSHLERRKKKHAPPKSNTFTAAQRAKSAIRRS